MSATSHPFPAWRDMLTPHYRQDEDEVVAEMLQEARLPDDLRQRITDRARSLVGAVRKNRIKKGGVDAFMHEYDLSTQEGLTLMCLAEALLRIPDSETADRLIRDKLSGTDWEKHLGQSKSIFVNASTIGLMITGRVLGPADLPDGAPNSVMKRLISRLGEPVIREALRQAMKIMGKQFVLGRTIDEAMKRGADPMSRGYRYSFDMLGEAARTDKDAIDYYNSYVKAITAIGKLANNAGIKKGPGISVKLSALHPRYESAKREQMLDVLVQRTLELAQLAKKYDLGFCIDAEESERLELSLEIYEAIYADPSLDGWNGFGLAIQAYSKRTRFVVDVLAQMVDRVGRPMMVRLVKGAYWDSEVKHTQEMGMSDFPLFTRKVATDVSYLACAKKMFDYGDRFFPQFATHNAHTAATIIELSQGRPFEFQRLHGMGEELHDEITPANKLNIPCRIYAPVGSHAELLSYLVRRLLENGANTSFVNRLVDDATPIDAIIADPVDRLAALPRKRHARIALPRHLYGKDRLNSAGIDLQDSTVLEDVYKQMDAHAERTLVAGPIINGQERLEPNRPVKSPADHRRIVGTVCEATDADVDSAIKAAQAGFADWSTRPVEDRASILEKAADLLEADTMGMMDICSREAGKTLNDGVAEVREAVDFLRYYALQARHHGAHGLKGRGVFVCISPWNFPLAIYSGQIAAALVVGNTVISKPAEQTPLVAAAMIRLLHQAGVPTSALQLLPGLGETVGAALVSDPRIAGVAFTGSEAVAQILNRTLAKRDEAIPLIAETGGLNAMIVDSSALPEQVCRDVIISAFGSAGQRCSALRVLFVQAEIADGLIPMIKGAMEELALGDPRLYETDIGPVIDTDALAMLTAHEERMKTDGRLIHATKIPESCANGTFFAPHAYELDSLSKLTREVFGPVLHIVRYAPEDLPKVLKAIRETGYGLTMGIHTRIDSQVGRIQSASAIGNTYVNRSMIGAVVGVQPFGGEGLSGTGPKAGGPNYLPRFGRFDDTADQADAQASHDLAMTSAKLMPADLPKAAAAESASAPSDLLPLALSPADRGGLGQKLQGLLNEKAATLTATLVRDCDIDAEAAAQDVLQAEAAVRSMTAQAADELAEPQVLPGPTGELNVLVMAPRGTAVLLAGSDATLRGLCGRLAAMLTGGNRVLMIVPPALSAAASLIVSGLGLPSDHLSVQVLDPKDALGLITAPSLDAVSIEGAFPGLVPAMAQRSGAIIPLDAEPLSPATLYRSLCERSLSWDKTAAGGNASLLTLNEDGPAE